MTSRKIGTFHQLPTKSDPSFGFGAVFVVRIILRLIDFFWEKCQNNSRKQEDFVMMYMHFCKNCNRIHILNGHKTACPGCGASLVELSITFQEYSAMNADDRAAFQNRCNDTQQLEKLRCIYRFGKYAKRDPIL